MEPSFAPKTSSDPKVVIALNSAKAERTRALGCLSIGGLLIVFLTYVLLRAPIQNNIWYWLMVLVPVGLAYVLYYTTKQAVADIRLRQKLDKQGVQVLATVVRHEVAEREDQPDLYNVYYQFQPDFIVKYTDFTTDRRFFNTPLGGKLSALYLSENPETTGLIL
jgi:hypothetical protein